MWKVRKELPFQIFLFCLNALSLRFKSKMRFKRTTGDNKKTIKQRNTNYWILDPKHTEIIVCLLYY